MSEFRSLPCSHRVQRMQDPVILLCSGQTYEREAITRWLGSKRTDPLSNKRVCSTRVVPNHSLRNAIEEQCDVVKCSAPHQCPFMCDRNHGEAVAPDREAATSCLCAFAVVVTIIAVYGCLAFLALFQRTALIGAVARSAALNPTAPPSQNPPPGFFFPFPVFVAATQLMLPIKTIPSKKNSDNSQCLRGQVAAPCTLQRAPGRSNSSSSF